MPDQLLPSGFPLEHYISQPPMGAVRAVVTPDLARRMLTRNDNNRNLRMRHVLSLAGAIERGEWCRNGDTIRFSASGRLLDGQHRLEAVLASGVPIDTDIVFGLPDDAQTTMDRGAKRHNGDMLQMEGFPNAKIIAAVAGLIWRYHLPVRMAKQAPTYAQIRDTIDRFPTLHPENFLPMSGKTGGVKQSELQFIRALTAFPDETLLEFRKGAVDGVGLVSKDDPRARLRAFYEGATKRSRPSPDYQLMAAVKAWNAFAVGKTLPFIRQYDTEAFPKVL